MTTKRRTTDSRKRLRRAKSRQSAFDDPRLLEMGLAGALSRTPEQHEAFFAEMERNARTSIDAALRTGRADAVFHLEMTLAATLGLICALEDHHHGGPTPVEAVGVLVTIDDRLALLAEHARVFYTRMTARSRPS